MAILAHEIIHWLTVDGRYVTDYHADGPGGLPDDKYYGHRKATLLADQRPQWAVYNNDNYEHFIDAIFRFVPDVRRVEVKSKTDATRTKHLIVACPSGMRAISAGGQAVGTGGAQLFDDLVIYDKSKVSVTAIQHSPSLLTPAQQPWYLVAHAICATDVEGRSAKAIQTVSAFSAPPNLHTATVRCPPGTRVIGTGADLQGSAGQASITSIETDAALTSVTVRGADRALQAGPLHTWKVRAFATCIDRIPGLTHAEATAGTSISIKHLARLQCPAGSRMTGMGAEVLSHYGLAVLSAVYARPELDGVEVLGYRTVPDSVPAFHVGGHRICAAL
jgi:hypothetical protein